MTVVSDSSLGLSSRPRLAPSLPATARKPARASRALRLVGVVAFVATSAVLVRWSVASFGPVGWLALWLPLMIGTATVLCGAISGNARREPAPRLTFLDSPTSDSAGLPCVVVASTGTDTGTGVELDPRPVSVDFYADDAVTVGRDGVTLWRAPHHLIQAVDVTGGLDRLAQPAADHPADPVESADLPDMFVTVHTAKNSLTLRPASGSTARLDVVVHDLRVDRTPAPIVSA